MLDEQIVRAFAFLLFSRTDYLLETFSFFKKKLEDKMKCPVELTESKTTNHRFLFLNLGAGGFELYTSSSYSSSFFLMDVMKSGLQLSLGFVCNHTNRGFPNNCTLL